MHIGLAFEHKEELSVGSFDRVRTDDSVRFEAVDCPFAIRLRSVVGAFVDIVSARIVKRIEPLLRAVLFVHVLDDVFAVNDGLVKSCNGLGSVTFVLGRFESRKRRSDFLDDDFLSLFALRASSSASFAASFFASAGEGVPS